MPPDGCHFCKATDRKLQDLWKESASTNRDQLMEGAKVCQGCQDAFYQGWWERAQNP